MRSYITIVLLLLVGACSGKDATLESKKTVLTNNTVIYPSLPDIDKPLPPLLKPIKFEYPRDISKPKQVKNTDECKKEPKIADYDNVCMEYPLLPNSNLFIGLDQQSFKNYISNQEQINGHIRSLSNRIDEVNEERAKWRSK